MGTQTQFRIASFVPPSFSLSLSQSVSCHQQIPILPVNCLARPIPHPRAIEKLSRNCSNFSTRCDQMVCEHSSAGMQFIRSSAKFDWFLLHLLHFVPFALQKFRGEQKSTKGELSSSAVHQTESGQSLSHLVLSGPVGKNS